MIDLYFRTLSLKDEQRSGWILRGIADPESVADHSWGTALLCMLHADRAAAGQPALRIDAARAVQMAIVHDLAEAVTGDVPTRVARMSDPDVLETKRSREALAMDELLSGGEAQIRSLWDEYEDSSTPTARFVRDMNLIDMCAQAYVYEQSGRYDSAAPNRNFPDFAGLDEFFATTRPRLSTAIGRELFDELAGRYAALESVAARGGLRLRPDRGARAGGKDDD